MSDIHSENSIEHQDGKSLNTSINQIQEHLEGLKVRDDQQDKLFYIVVEALAEKGYGLPSGKMTEIREMNIGSDSFFVIRFQDSVSISFNKNKEEDVLVTIKGDQYVMAGEEARQYREKYYAYTVAFVQMRRTIIQGKSSLAKTRLEKLGI